MGRGGSSLTRPVGRARRDQPRYLTSLNWNRFQSLLEAKIIEANPAEGEARAQAAEAESFVWTGRTTGCGLKTLYTRTEAGEIIWFVAMLEKTV